MDKDITFSYHYSAKENQEILEIRKKYLPQSESKLEELKRLDRCVQSSGMTESLSTGIGGMLVFGLGMCLSMRIIGDSIFFIILGVLLGIAGLAGMIAAYPVYQSVFRKTKAKLTPRILELTAELSGEHIS